MSKKNQSTNDTPITSESTFRHNTSIGPNGEILFDAPIEIKDQADLDNYGITWNDCRTLNFHGSDKVTVYFFKTENRAFAEYQWSYLDTQHSRGYASRVEQLQSTQTRNVGAIIKWCSEHWIWLAIAGTVGIGAVTPPGKRMIASAAGKIKALPV